MKLSSRVIVSLFRFIERTTEFILKWVPNWMFLPYVGPDKRFSRVMFDGADVTRSMHWYMWSKGCVPLIDVENLRTLFPNVKIVNIVPSNENSEESIYVDLPNKKILSMHDCSWEDIEFGLIFLKNEPSCESGEPFFAGLNEFAFVEPGFDQSEPDATQPLLE